MKPLHLLPPLTALVAGGVWLGWLVSSGNSLSESNTALRERIAAARFSNREDSPVSVAEQRTRNRPATVNGRKIPPELREWQHLAESLLQVDTTGGLQSLRLNLRLQSRLKKMSAEEILTLFDDLSASDLSREGLAAVQRMFFDTAAEKDPQLTLRHFESVLADGSHPLSWSVSAAFGRWMTKDSAGATAWFDEMSAAGNFETKRLDGMNQTLLNCAGPVIASLLAADPAASLARLQALPEDQRMAVLSNASHFGSLKPGTELAFATLVRQGLGADQRANGFRTVANRMASEQGFSKVSEFLDTIGASAEERGKTAESAAIAGLAPLLRRNGEITELHDWLVQQTPQTADRNAGQALAINLGQLGFEKTLAMVSELHAKTGSDQLLESFLSNGQVSSHGDQAMALAGQIKDPALRERMQSMILLKSPKPAATP